MEILPIFKEKIEILENQLIMDPSITLPDQVIKVMTILASL